MCDYKQCEKKELALHFIRSRYGVNRFLMTCDIKFRGLDSSIFVEWVKDLAISVQCDADFWHTQSNNFSFVIENLDREIERLNLKVCQLAEQNAKLASDGIKVTNKLADMSEENRQLKNTISCYEDSKMDEIYDTMCRNKQNSIVDIADDIIMNSDLLAENKKLKDGISTLTDVNMRYCKNEEKLITTNQQLQSENQSLMAEIEELKSISGHRDNMQFIACCQKIVQDAEELKKHLEGGK